MPLCRHICLKPAIAVICEWSSLHVLCIGTDPRRLWIKCFKMYVWLSVTATEWILYLGITDSTSWKYDPNKNFYWILSSEQISNMSATFVLTNWEKRVFIPVAVKKKVLMIRYLQQRRMNVFSTKTYQYHSKKKKTLLQTYCCELGKDKEIVLNTGWLCTCPKIDFGSF